MAIDKRNPTSSVRPFRPMPSRKMPRGDEFKAKVARGLIRWRAKQKLSVDECAQKYGIDRTAWYRVEKAFSSGITASHIDEICSAIGVEDINLLQLGKHDDKESRSSHSERAVTDDDESSEERSLLELLKRLVKAAESKSD